VNKTAIIGFSCIVLLASCAKQTVKQQGLPQSQQVAASPSRQKANIVERTELDTLSYVIEFPGALSRSTFAKDFHAFMQKYRIEASAADTSNRYVRLHLVLPPDTGAHAIPAAAKPLPAESAPINPAPLPAPSPAAVQPMDSPRFGGAVTLFSDRRFLDDDVVPLVSAYPLGVTGQAAPSAIAGLLTVEQISARKVRLLINENPTAAAGRRRTAFDVAKAWSDYVRGFAAEGAAMFRYVKGVAGFIRGEEAVIPGIRIVDESTIDLALEADDSLAALRLATSRLLPASLGLGPYRIKSSDKTSFILTPGAVPAIKPGYLDKLMLILDTDDNPLVSFSLNRYDAVCVFYSRDLDYARRSLAAQADCVPLSCDRYFVALTLDSAGARRAVASLLTAKDILASVPKVEASIIGAVESDSAPAAVLDTARLTAPSGEALSLLYNSGDPLSGPIAEKIVARLARAGVACKLTGAAPGDYERALYNRKYSLAVGWVSGRVLSSRTERLRLATMWFGDATSEPRRIAEGFEVPLFSVQRYILCKKNVGLAGGTLAGLYLKSAGR
jgi:hypothetical protein